MTYPIEFDKLTHTVTETTARTRRFNRTPVPEGFTPPSETNWRGYKEVQRYDVGKSIKDVQLFSDGRYAVLTRGHELQLIDPTSNTQTTLIDTKTGASVSAMTITDDDKVAMVKNGHLFILDPQTGEMTHISYIWGMGDYGREKLISTRTGLIAICGKREAHLEVWDRNSLQSTSIPPPEEWGFDDFEDIAVAPDDTIFAGTRNGRVTSYNVAKKTCTEIKGTLSHIAAVGVLPDGTPVWVERFHGKVTLMVGEESKAIGLNPDTFWFVDHILEVTPEGKILLPDENGFIYVFDPLRLQPERGTIKVEISDKKKFLTEGPIASIRPQQDGTIIVATREGRIFVLKSDSQEYGDNVTVSDLEESYTPHDILTWTGSIETIGLSFLRWLAQQPETDLPPDISRWILFIRKALEDKAHLHFSGEVATQQNRLNALGLAALSCLSFEDIGRLLRMGENPSSIVNRTMARLRTHARPETQQAFPLYQFGPQGVGESHAAPAKAAKPSILAITEATDPDVIRELFAQRNYQFFYRHSRGENAPFINFRETFDRRMSFSRPAKTQIIQLLEEGGIPVKTHQMSSTGILLAWIRRQDLSKMKEVLTAHQDPYAPFVKEV